MQFSIKVLVYPDSWRCCNSFYIAANFKFLFMWYNFSIKRNSWSASILRSNKTRQAKIEVRFFCLCKSVWSFKILETKDYLYFIKTSQRMIDRWIFLWIAEKRCCIWSSDQLLWETNWQKDKLILIDKGIYFIWSSCWKKW